MNVEFRVINTSEMPPIVISQNENDEPKVVRIFTRKDGYGLNWLLERTV